MEESGGAAVARGSLDKLVDKINSDRGIDLSQYRRAYLERRVLIRLRNLGLTTYRQYADHLDQDPGEYGELIDTLTVNVTDFFRDRVVWDVIHKKVLHGMIAEKSRGRSRTIRVWSAGCATGEEPYSIAMMLLDLLGEDASRFLVGVTATDLDDNALGVAQRGAYDLEKASHIPPSYQVRFTRRIGDARFEILPEVRKLVRFSRFSLFDDSPMKVMDLVICRNVFIYFSREQQAKVVENFYKSLVPGGYLVLGRSEKLAPEVAAMFIPIEGKERVYRKPHRR